MINTIFLKNISKKFILLDLLAGLKVTGEFLLKPKETIQFPEENTPYSTRFRGLLALRRYPSGEERCIACKLCEAVCPSLAITIEAEPRDDGSRRTTRYDWDAFKCIYCGLCQQACPVDAVVLTGESNWHVESQSERIFDKSLLLRIGEECEEQIAKNEEEESSYR